MSGKDNNKNKGLGKDFWCYRGGEFLSDLGTSAQTLAIAWWVLEMTGSAASMATVLVPTMIAQIIFSPLLAPLGDRFARKKIMLWANAGKIVTVSTMAWLFFNEAMTIPALIALAISGCFFGCLFTAGSEAIVSNLVKADQLQKANQSIQSLNAITMLLGGAFGATMVATIGIKGAVLVNLVSFFASVIGISLISQNTKPKREDNNGLTIANWSRDIYLGFRALIKVRVVLVLVIAASLINMALLPVIIMVPYLVKETLGLSPYYVGIIEAAIAIGALIGSVTLSLVTKRIANHRALLLGIVVIVAMMIIPAVMQSYWLLVAGFTLSMVGSLWVNILIQTQMTVAIPDHFRSRILSSMGILSALAAPFGVTVSGILTDSYGAWPVLLGCVSLAALTIPLFAIIPNMANFFNKPEDEVGGWVLDTYPGAFDSSNEQATPNETSPKPVQQAG
ncbi:hypothetical protein CS022_08035 [Veronia nyctiphanis]|uniref:Major facilitator superfamily (MFS) profile domain-containing protein n=1 Tax=Veronia nyctiphanis TaxID=1278244 RepID=A0A4Q0YR80_9GAMM|nr:MFS transporter [Veronia nyctiphanis]RXJ73680.1 hypothetical protein CS022_08035 [Veronia nyctiphanis]